MPLSPSHKQLSTTGFPRAGPALARQLWGKVGGNSGPLPVALFSHLEQDSCLCLQLLGHPSSGVG